MTGVAVVGGGLAGLAAAQRLTRAHGLAVTVFDQGSRAPGGRASSRVFETANGLPLSFDAGAQYFSCTQPQFQQAAAEWVAAGVAAQWPAGHAAHECIIDADVGSLLLTSHVSAAQELCPVEPKHPAMVGVPTNDAIVAHTVRQIQSLGGKVLTGHRATGGAWDGQRWRLQGELITHAGKHPVELGSFAALVFADAGCLLPSAPGRMRLTGAESAVAAAEARLQQVGFTPTFTLMVAFAQSLEVPFGAAYVHGYNTPVFGFVANNSSKPGRPDPFTTNAPECWTALATPEASRALIEEHGSRMPQSAAYREAVARRLLAEWRTLMQPFVPEPQRLEAEPVHLLAQRWGRAFVAQPLGVDLLARSAERLALCGDFCKSSTVEGAWLSGEAAADVVAGMLK